MKPANFVSPLYCAGRAALFSFILIISSNIPAQAQTPPASTSQQPQPPTTVVSNAPWSRIVMIGASASAGFTASEPLGGPNTPQFRLSRYLDAALLVPHTPVQNFANALFFVQPEGSGQNEIDQAVEAKPTLLLATDFLFWFCYGEGRTDEERLKRFEYGLKLLETFSCPVVVGDIPDASAAVGSMLLPEQMPSRTALSAANRRLKEWAAAHPQVVIVALADFMRNATADKAITVRGITLPDGKTRALLQDDHLHPSVPGCAVLALAILDAFQSKQATLLANNICWDPGKVCRLVFEPASPPSAASAQLAPTGRN